MDNQNYIYDKEKRIISNPHRGIVYEEKQDFSKSIFEKVYRRAYSLIQESVPLLLEKDDKDDFDAAPDNMVVFVGRRGTGKTSAMLSFMKALGQNGLDWPGKDDSYTVYEKKNGDTPVHFISIDWIDASMLERGEDIFEVILAKMFKEFLEEMEDNSAERITYEKRELHSQFASIYKKYQNLRMKSGSDRYTTETAVSSLRDIGRSVDIRKEFQKLVRRYIHMKVQMKAQSKYADPYRTFLVVAIDDLDMNVESGFEILETIQRYLKVDRLLVLLAVNHEQTKICCQKHFSRAFTDYAGFMSENSRYYVKDRIISLAEQYMEKSLPAYARIYLPSLKKSDYDRSNITKIQLALQGEAENYSFKKAVFLLTVQKTMVRYDTEGKKRHFLEPDSLRKLNDFWIFRENLANLPGQTDERFLEVMDYNSRRCMDDLLFHYADEALSEKAAKFFLELSETDIQRRGEMIVTDFFRKISKKSKTEMYFAVPDEDKQGFHHMFEDDYDVFKYSYGELLRALYFLGREDIYEKNLVSALLAMYTLTLTKIFYRYKRGMDKDTRKRNYNMLKKVMAGSVAGSWSRYILPCVNLGSGSVTPHYTGASKNVRLDKVSMELDEESVKVIQKAIQEIDDNPESTPEKYICEATKVCKALKRQFILLLFLKMKKGYFINSISAAEMKESTEGSEELKNKSDIEIQIEVSEADYNVLNFIDNIFQYSEFLREFVSKVYRMIENRQKKDSNDGEKGDGKGSTEEIVDAIIVELQKEPEQTGAGSTETEKFYFEMKTWMEESGGAVVPFYSTDIFYNLLKRLTRNQSLHSKNEIRKNEFYTSMQKLLDEIKNSLEKNDKFYKKDKFSFVENFSDCFSNCPVIKYLLAKDDGPDNKMEQLFNDLVGQFVDSERNIKKGEAGRLAQLLAI